ncbi:MULTISPECIES: hypothetical protein [Actinosynnema]|uniref:hypothetical protein n=1 Tax=Actinosynnema TaxID=40566 RepID=UPI0020A602AE|nr:hypothetical protein [Actinosynnema pretiosum]MCP2098970.1 hypothetical protein [Actinosynnema pretiosum]
MNEPYLVIQPKQQADEPAPRPTTTLPKSDLELLSSALQDALAAQEQGLVIGPPVDEITLRRAERRARRADAARTQETYIVSGAA